MKKPKPPAGSVWSRIEQARESLPWSERKLSEEALGNQTHYGLLGRRGWKSETETQDKVIAVLERLGFSGSWLRSGVLPERSDGDPLPESPKIIAQLTDLARKLGMPADQILELWTETEGPLEKLSDECQRAAFAAAYLDGRSLEDARLAVQRAQRSVEWRKGSGVTHMLQRIRFELELIKPASGTMGRLTMVPRSED